MHTSILNDLSLLIGQAAALLTALTAFWTLVKNKRKDSNQRPPLPPGGHSGKDEAEDGEG